MMAVKWENQPQTLLHTQYRNPLPKQRSNNKERSVKRLFPMKWPDYIWRSRQTLLSAFLLFAGLMLIYASMHQHQPSTSSTKESSLITKKSPPVPLRCPGDDCNEEICPPGYGYCIKTQFDICDFFDTCCLYPLEHSPLGFCVFDYGQCSDDPDLSCSLALCRPVC